MTPSVQMTQHATLRGTACWRIGLPALERSRLRIPGADAADRGPSCADGGHPTAACRDRHDRALQAALG